MVEKFSLQDKFSREDFYSLVLQDYRRAVRSREMSKVCRKEVLQGYASFGISGDGKELPQVVMAHYFQKGDFLSGYYRDQTFCLAKNIISEKEYFAQLYADVEFGNDPCSSGRQMNSHFATPFLDENGKWLNLMERYNVPANMSQTAGQMPRSIGLGFVSALARKAEQKGKPFSRKITQGGNEVCFCTIGDGSTAEGHFWETIHTAASLQIPLAVFIWDDGYGISVPSNQYMSKGNIAEAIKGMEKTKDTDKKVIKIHTAKGWDYVELHQVISEGIEHIRTTHTPAVFHITDLTQPLGHSSSGSHERYKNKERLDWEREFDCNTKMKAWILENGIASEEELQHIETESTKDIKNIQKRAWEDYLLPIRQQQSDTENVFKKLSERLKEYPLLQEEIDKSLAQWKKEAPKFRHQILSTLRRVQTQLIQHGEQYKLLTDLLQQLQKDAQKKFSSFVYSVHKSAAEVRHIPARFPAKKQFLPGYKILNEFFDIAFAEHDDIFAFGEDVGNIGDVNQGFSQLQEKHGEFRIFDTSIRELTIVGQAVGMALRGLRPIAEIQYVDYLLYGFQPLSDDVATLHFRTAGKQSCPLIIRTRGHRLEGIWHSGSPMSLIANAMRGFMIGVPRNMTQAAAMYNALLESNDPGIVIESLNGYRIKEPIPSNLNKIKLPFGLCEVLREGEHITLVSYGSTLRIVEEAAIWLYDTYAIKSEIIDIQTLAPFDTKNIILNSLKKTNRILFIDEDIEGGFSSTMLDEVINRRGGFYYLDATPRTVSAKEHRTSYGRDGEYFGKPSFDDIVEAILKTVNE